MMEGLMVTPHNVDVPEASETCRVEMTPVVKEAVDHLQALVQQEEAAYPNCLDYLTFFRQEFGQTHEVVNEGWRRKLCEWCYEVVDHFGFDREAVAIALDYLDRCVAAKAAISGTPIGKRGYQLLAVTSLYMAIKIHGESEVAQGPRRKLRITTFVELSRGFFSVEAIEKTESEILSILKWLVNPPTHLRFVATLLRLCPRWIDQNTPNAHAASVAGVYDVARYLTEISTCVSTFAFSHKKSTVAYAAILCGIDATVLMPYDARIKFQNNVAESLHLYPNDPEVVRTKTLLRDLCPTMFREGQLPASFFVQLQSQESQEITPSNTSGGKSSPVCVADVGSTECGRKRGRNTNLSPSSQMQHDSIM